MEVTSERALDLDRHDRAAREFLEVAASRADEVEVHVDGELDAFVRFADVGPTQCADRERVVLSFRVRKEGAHGWREAGAKVGSLDREAWTPALERALTLLEHSPENPEALPLPEAGRVESVSHSTATELHGVAGKLGWIDQALKASAEAQLAPAGLAETRVCATTLFNSKGLAVQGSTSKASFSLTVSGDGANGIGQCIAHDVQDLDVTSAIRQSTEKGIASRAPEVFAPCETTVVLEPLAVSSILLFAAYSGFGAREVEEGTSFLAGREGDRLFSDCLSISDNARHPLLRELPFDGEGVKKSRVALVENGVLCGPVTDRAHAERMGLACTGHSPRRPSGQGPMAQSMVVKAGNESVEELIRGVDDGLLVSQFHYTNLIEPRELTLTGMTRNGTFRIRNGEVVGAVKNLRFTQALTQALGRVSGVGSDEAVVGALFDGHLVTPSLVLDGFRFTSTTDF